MKQLIFLSLLMLTACNTRTTVPTTQAHSTSTVTQTTTTSIHTSKTDTKTFTAIDKSISLSTTEKWVEHKSDTEAKLHLINYNLGSTIRILTIDKSKFGNLSFSEIAKTAFQSGFDTLKEFTLTDTIILEKPAITTTTDMIEKGIPLTVNLAIIDYDGKIIFIINTNTTKNYNTHVVEEINKVLNTLKIH